MTDKLTPEHIAHMPDVPPEQAFPDQAQRHNGQTPSSPLPLARDVLPPEAYPLAALGEVLAPMATRLLEIVQAPDAICGQAVLAAAAQAVQAHADVCVDGRQHPLSLYLIVVGESGERKTETDRLALWPQRRHERALLSTYEYASTAYRDKTDAYKKAREEALKKAKGYAAKEAALTALGPAPVAPVLPILTTEEPSYEGLVKLLLTAWPSVGLYSDEGGRLIGGYAMSPEHQLKTAAGLSELWDGKRISRVRSGDGTAVLYGRRLSMHLMVQPVVAEAVLSNRTLIDQGLMTRCLVAWPQSTIGHRPYQAVNLSEDPDVQRYNAAITNALKRPLPLAEGTQNELTPRTLSLSPQAKARWVAFHDHVEAHLRDDGPLAPIRGVGSKAPQHALRLAGVLTLVSTPDAADIPLNAVDAGMALAEFYLSEALRLFHREATDPKLRLAQQLLDWARRFEKVHLAQMYQYGPSAVRDAKTARKMVGILEEHGWLTRIEGGEKLDGMHRREVWQVRKL